MTVSWLRPHDVGSRPENPAHRVLGMSLGHRGESSASIIEVAAQSEKPGIMLPSRTRDSANNSSTNGNGGGWEIAGEA